MRYAIISDIHSNIEALNEAMTIISGKKIDRVVALGDIVGYGPNPEECVNTIIKNSIVSVMGNHDYTVNFIHYEENLNEYARAAIRWTRENISNDSKSFLKDLPFSNEIKNFTMFHGSLDELRPFAYILYPGDAAVSFSKLKTEIGFFGHSHMPGCFYTDSKGTIELIRASGNQSITLEESKRYLINVGSVGQPRDGIPRGCFVIFDSLEMSIEFIRFRYDIEAVYNKILKAGLPIFLGERLFIGF
jgi:predicted phosphodiesterase